MQSDSVRPWFALRIRSRHEKTAAQFLATQGYEQFLPLCKSLRRWSDRVKEVELPFFPGYLFARFDPLRRVPILATPGVVSIVGMGPTPVPVADDEMAALQSIMESGAAVEPWRFLHVGRTVRIEVGPLRGLEGILLEIKNKRRLVVSVSLLQRSVAVEIDGCGVTAVGSAPRPPMSEINRSCLIATRYA